MDDIRYRNTYLTRTTRKAFEMIAKKACTNADQMIEESLQAWLKCNYPETFERINAMLETQERMESEILNGLKGNQ